MPDDEEIGNVVEKPKRAPRKRVAKPVSDDEESAPIPTRAPRRRAAPRRTAPSQASTAPVVNERISTRKAPTPISTQRASKKTAKRQLIVVGVLMLVGVGSSAIVGLTDKGTIDINHLIDERNRKVQSGEIQDGLIPVQNTNREPDGGLIPLGDNAPLPVVATSTASTTNATASSTATSTPVSDLTPTAEELIPADQAAAIE